MTVDLPTTSHYPKLSVLLKSIMYYLKLSGYIPETKQLEFEQTYRLVTTQIPRACTGYNISKDALNEGVYHFISYWSSISQINSFSHSASYLMMTGAFKTLGELYENVSGEMMQSKN
jgi:quinol monooxygenase YgiN